MIDPRGVGYLYIIQKAEHVGKCVDNTSAQIFKVGRAFDVPDRLKQYPRGSQLIVALRVNNMLCAENTMINAFKCHLIHRQDFGNEYFECTEVCIVDLFIDMSKLLKGTARGIPRMKESPKVVALEEVVVERVIPCIPKSPQSLSQYYCTFHSR